MHGVRTCTVTIHELYPRSMRIIDVSTDRVSIVQLTRESNEKEKKKSKENLITNPLDARLAVTTQFKDIRSFSASLFSAAERLINH